MRRSAPPNVTKHSAIEPFFHDTLEPLEGPVLSQAAEVFAQALASSLPQQARLLGLAPTQEEPPADELPSYHLSD